MDFLGGSVVKNLPVMQETQEMQVQSLSWEDPLEEEMATHSSILAWESPMNRGACWATICRVSESWTQLGMAWHMARCFEDSEAVSVSAGKKFGVKLHQGLFYISQCLDLIMVPDRL